ncbi:thiolase domain-containing protein [Halosolutus halophilus]|uniref:thiolase domain-containing protein n=1 Tax=Halosolutus halophilus TaxID=1552990 RepID=UPI002234FA66|nr:thiolase domain-containing protein [Halosolutus halophilus]
MTAVRIAGVGMTPFGSHPETTGRELFGEASCVALDDAGVPCDDVDALFYGNFMGAFAEKQNHHGPLMADAAGVTAPATRFESACASSGVAVREAVSKIRAGQADVILVGGMERMTNLSTASTTEALATAGDELYEGRAGLTFPGAYAMMTDAYFAAHDADRTDLAHIAVKNHANAVENELAQYQQAIDIDDVLEAPMVADPVGLYDASPITDGASALVLTGEDYAEANDLDASIAVTGSGQGTDSLSLQGRESLTRTPAAEQAAEDAYTDANVGPDDIDVAEVHDCFTIAEVLAIESLGFYEPGTGYRAARDGETTRDGDLPVNLSGGLKAKGHPVGATGAAQLVELTKLLRGEHVNSDAVADAETAVTHNAGATVASAVVHVLEVVE